MLLSQTMGNSNLRQQREFPDGAGALHLPRSSGGRWARPAGQKARRLSHLRCSSLKRWNRRRDGSSLPNSGTSSKWEVSYSVRPSYALGWRQVQRTCTCIILRMAEETVNLLFSKLFQVRYHFKQCFYPKRWEIRICDSKENFPMVQVHCTCRGPAAYAGSVRQDKDSGGSRSSGARP